MAVWIAVSWFLKCLVSCNNFWEILCSFNTVGWKILFLFPKYKNITLNILCSVDEHVSPAHLKITGINFSKSSVKINRGITVTLKNDLSCLRVILLFCKWGFGIRGMFLRVPCWDCLHGVPSPLLLLQPKLFCFIYLYAVPWMTFVYKPLKVVKKILN